MNGYISQNWRAKCQTCPDILVKKSLDFSGGAVVEWLGHQIPSLEIWGSSPNGEILQLLAFHSVGVSTDFNPGTVIKQY